jgi:hypothetical protein
MSAASDHNQLPDERLPSGVLAMLQRVTSAKGCAIRAVLYHWRNTVKAAEGDLATAEAALMSMSSYHYHAVRTDL